MLLFMYMIYVIYFISKLKKEGKRVSLFTKIVVYSPLPLIGTIVSFALGGMRLVLRIVIATALLLLSLSLFLDSKKSDPDTPLIEHWLRFGYHILLMLL